MLKLDNSGHYLKVDKPIVIMPLESLEALKLRILQLEDNYSQLAGRILNATLFTDNLEEGIVVTDVIKKEMALIVAEILEEEL
jgi:hypothetical protein